MLSRSMRLCLPILLASPLGLSHATEEDILEEVVVTAEFRHAPVQDLPASVTVVRPDFRGDVVSHLEEVLDQVPNVNFASGASRGRFYQIRGIGERSQFSEPVNSSVGLIVDGVDLSGIGAAATLFDVRQVEVLRGPQGTLYGANAMAGLINIVTPAPRSTHSARLRLDAGDYGAFGAGAMVSGPLSEQAGYRVSVQRYRDDGFMENDFLGRDNTSNHDEITMRAKFTWEGDTQSWQLSLGRIDVQNGFDAFSLDNDRTTLSDEPGFDEQLTEYAALRWTHSGERATFTGSAALASSDVNYGYDEDWTFTGFDPIGYTSTDVYQRERDTQTLEARWVSNPGEGLLAGTWDWVAGIYGLRQTVDFERTYTFAGPFASDYEVERVALYGELSRPLGERWVLTIGARAERHAADYVDTDSSRFDPEDDLFGGRVMLEYELDGGGLLYAGVTQGYKTGGFNQDGSLPASLREFDTETLWNVEAGYKASLLDGRLDFRGTVFRMQRDDVQLQTSRTIPVPGSPVGDFVVYKGNAAQGFNQGIELEADWFVGSQLTLFGSVGWLDTEYDSFVDANGDTLRGREQAHAPSYQFFVGAEFAFSEAWRARIEIEGKDEFYFSDSHSEQSDAYELVNASISYTAERWQVKVWGRNLTDEDYLVRGFMFGNDPRDFYTARAFTQLGEPARVGVSVSVDL